jgi:predicted MPP superfamily phosphohydrolase
MITLVMVLFVLVLIDWYLFQAVITLAKTSNWKLLWYLLFWFPTILTLFILFWWALGDPYAISANVRNWMITGIVSVYFSKLFGLLFVFADDLSRGFRWIVKQFYRGTSDPSAGETISRSEFLSKAALVATAVPFGTMAYGILSGAHDYRVRRTSISLKNLPASFDGIRLVHLSDIHTGSFWNKTAVEGGVEMALSEKPDLIFFTGDLVNNESGEVKEYIDVFKQLKAPLGVYSVTGNHDYGDYKSWNTQEEKRQNFADLIEAHRLLGFDLLMNSNRIISQGGEKLAILGNENWGAGRFSKYGKLDLAHQGTQEAAVKLLLSHDPSHWDAQVRPQFPDIDMMFAGHTHGFQFGIEMGNFKWSPSQYAYRQWAGWYTEGNQHLYVNRGFGYLGYPGRVGMPPEITVVELKRA